MYKKTYMNTYEQFLVGKMRKKSVTDVRKRKQWEGDLLVYLPTF